MCLPGPTDPDVQGICSFPCCPGNLGIHDRPTKNSLCITNVGKVCKDLCLERLFDFKCPLCIDPACCRNGADEREGIRKTRGERWDIRCPEAFPEVLANRHKRGVAEDVELCSAQFRNIVKGEAGARTACRAKAREG